MLNFSITIAAAAVMSVTSIVVLFHLSITITKFHFSMAFDFTVGLVWLSDFQFGYIYFLLSVE